jgi:hypothetical protein
MQASLMRVWAPTGQTPVVKVHPGRDNTHVYGALNLHSGEEVTLCSDRMNAQVSALFLNRLLLTYPDKPYCCYGIVLPGIAGQRYVRYWTPIRVWKCCGCPPVRRS